MLLQHKNKGKVLKCLKCGYEEKNIGGENEVKVQPRKDKSKILVIDKDIEMKIYPKINITCPRCGYHEAYYELRQMRSADEPSTRFYTCVRCKFRWKEDE